MKAGPKKAGHRLDAGLSVLLGLAAFAAYAPLALALGQTVYSSFLNLAFDFDPAFFVRFLTSPDTPDGLGINFKHPLWFLFRPTAWPFMALGYEARQAAGLAMALVGAGSVSLCYGFARLLGAGRPESAAATLFFAATSTTLFTAIIPESYGWANFSILMLWCAYLYGVRSGALRWRLLVPVTLIATGVTLTNFMQGFVAGCFAPRDGAGWRDRVQTLAALCVGVGLLVTVILVLVQPGDVWHVLTHPVQTFKVIYWQQTKGPKVGLSTLLQTFFGYSFFAPGYTPVRLGELVTMLDFREWRYGGLAGAAVLAWLAWLLANVGIGLRSAQARSVWLPLLVVVALNLLFHLSFQFRGSVYIYAAHLHFPIFALSLAAAPLVAQRSRGVRLGYCGALCSLALAAAVANGTRAWELVEHCRHLVVPITAPEVKP